MWTRSRITPRLNWEMTPGLWPFLCPCARARARVETAGRRESRPRAGDSAGCVSCRVLARTACPGIFCVLVRARTHVDTMGPFRNFRGCMCIARGGSPGPRGRGRGGLNDRLNIYFHVSFIFGFRKNANGHPASLGRERVQRIRSVCRVLYLFRLHVGVDATRKFVGGGGACQKVSLHERKLIAEEDGGV